jgi:hypothetical protein
MRVCTRYLLQGLIEGEEVDVDARPSDAINLAVRFGVRGLSCAGCCHCLLQHVTSMRARAAGRTIAPKQSRCAVNYGV